MHTTRVFILIAIVYLMGFFAHFGILHKTVYGDGIFYYSWLRSSVVDQDIRFENEYAHFQVSQPKTYAGLSGNKYSIGPAALWYPWFLWTHLLVGKSGYEIPYQIVVGLSGVLYALTGLVLLFSVISKYFSKIISLTAILCTAFATNLLFYGSIDTVNSHAVSFFACALFLTFLFQPERRWFRIGISLGLVGLIRPQDLIIGTVALGFIKPKEYLRFLMGFVYAFAPQLVVWQILNGTFLTSPYISSIEGFSLLNPHIIGVLFSPQNGLLLWTPVVLIGIIGFWFKKAPRMYKTMGIIFFVQLYIISAWSVWWQGASYSGRMFIGTLPLIAFGIARFFETVTGPKLRPTVVIYAITIPLCVLNALSIVYFLVLNI